MKQLFALFSIAILVLACDKEGGKISGGGGGTPTQVSVTGGFSDVTESSATLTATANLPAGKADAEFGFIYSTEMNPTVETGIIIVAEEALGANKTYSVTVTGLSPNTTYYYRSYVNLRFAA